MGGILILLSIIISTLLFADITDSATWVLLGVMLVFGAAGFFDDYVKVKKHTPDALTVSAKLFIQFAAAFGIAFYAIMQYDPSFRFRLVFSYIPYWSINLRYLYILFVMIVIAGTSNAVNLSDGLDGLAAGLLIPAFLVFGIVMFLIDIGTYSNMATISAATIGACLGFLWFNCSPAKIFMGDTGSLALGALLGSIAAISKLEILLAVVGIVFVVESLSVMIQVFWYKQTQKRVFLMAPIHHHFEQLGWKETTVVMRFWIVAWIAAVIGLTWFVTQLLGGF